MIGNKQLENVEYFTYLGSVITNDASCTHEIKSMISMVKVALNKGKALFINKLDLNLGKKPVNYYTGYFKKSFTTLKAYRNLYRGHTQRFELSKCSKTHRVLPRIVMVQCDFH